MSLNQTEERLIAGVPLFATLPRDELRQLLDILRMVELPAGEVLIREDEPGDCLYVIVEGQVEIIKALGTADERLIRIHEAGSFFGEMSLLDPDGRRTASARMHSDARLWQLARSDFEQLLQRRPSLAYEMLRVLSLRLRETHTATIADLRERNRQLSQAYDELRAAQAQIVEKEKLERELQVARQIQQSILPRQVPRLAGFDFGVRMMPARAVGGDLFDFIPLDQHREGIVIGDVSDKGVPAAIFMALTRSLLRAEATRGGAPGKVLARVNHLLMSMNDAGMFVTLLYGVLDARNHEFAYARAGHEVPLLFAADGAVSEAGYGPGQPLGMFNHPALDERMISIATGSTLLMFTDGATDVKNPDGVRFGAPRLQQTVRDNLGGSAQATCDGIWRRLADYQADSPQADDVALLAVRAYPADAAS